MAHNLLKAGHPVVVYDVVPKAVEAAVAAGATSVGTPKDVAKQVGVWCYLSISHILHSEKLSALIKVYTRTSGVCIMKLVRLTALCITPEQHGILGRCWGQLSTRRSEPTPARKEGG